MSLALTHHPKRSKPSLPPPLQGPISPSSPLFPTISPPIEKDRGGLLLTSLPDNLRLHILSFLPHSDAIRTGVLSSCWKYLWQSRHLNRPLFVLQLSLLDGVNPLPFLQEMSLLLRDRSRFIHSLSLSFQCAQHHVRYLDVLLHLAARHGVPDVALDLRSMDHKKKKKKKIAVTSLQLRAPFFSALVKLELCGLRFTTDPDYFKSLVNLEHLTLCMVNITDSALQLLVVASCSSLKVLDLRACPDLRNVVIRGDRIVKVVVMVCPSLEELEVECRELKKFHYRGGYTRKFLIENVEGLKDVLICYRGIDIENPVSNWLGAVGGLLWSVTVLTLCDLSIQYIMEDGPDAIDKLNNLECLSELQIIISSISDNTLFCVCEFLRSCSSPRLERLFIKLPVERKFPARIWLFSMEELILPEPPMNMLENVKTIKLYFFKGHPYELNLMMFLLANSPNLESFTVISTLMHKSSNGITTEIHSNVLDKYRANFGKMDKLSRKARIDISETDDDGLKPVHSFGVDTKG